MFNFFKRKREYVSCEWLEYGVHFSPLGIEDCCMYIPKNQDFTPVSCVKNGKYDYKDFFKKKNIAKKQHAKGIISERCKGCYNLKKDIWKSSKVLSHVVFNLNYKCNSDCIYCYTHKNKRFFNNFRDVPIFDFVKYAVEKKIILPDCDLHLGGGEPLLNDEFEAILNFLLDNNFNNISIYSSGIQYSSAVDRAVKNGACKLYISTDSGSEELYKKIKCVDKYYECWNNIKTYCKSQTLEKNKSVCLKYIIIPEINDNKKDIDSFLEKVSEVNARVIVVDIERNWYKQYSEKDEEVKNLLWYVKYIEVYCEKNNIEYIHFPACVYVLNKHREFYDSIVINCENN